MKARKAKSSDGGSAGRGRVARTASPATPRRTQHTKKSASGKNGGRWIAGVTTVSTFPPRGLFTKDASTIARSLASKKVSPKGPASGLRMLLFFINRAGKGLSPQRRAELEKAKALLSDRIRNRKEPHKNG